MAIKLDDASPSQAVSSASPRDLSVTLRDTLIQRRAGLLKRK